MTTIKEEFHVLFIDQGTLKFFFGVLAVSTTWLFNGEYTALIAIISLRLIDFLTGTYHALFHANEWTSSKSYEGIKKTGHYFILILVVRLLDKVLPVRAFSPLMDMYIALTEAGSILQNLKKMGYDVPTTVVNKIKSLLTIQ